ncbi:MAG: hypothetical protein HKN37_01935, partial [Rhodothermales bacterium]|nr:hypothetical protein [Rhodothermales bacterium]
MIVSTVAQRSLHSLRTTNRLWPIAMMESRRIRKASAMWWTIAALVALFVPVATHAQAPLFYANDGTLVRKISFKYVDQRTLEADELKQKIVTTSPTTVDRIKRYIPFVSPTRHRFDPVVLQKDVVRLRRHYREHGFLFAEVDYPASQLDTTHNTIHVIFSIVEGPPLILQDFGFYDSDGNYTLDALPTRLQRDWVRFRDQLSLQVGQRYTDAERIRIQDQVLNWMKERGFAFARVTASARVDSVFSTADVQYVIEPGPVT